MKKKSIFFLLIIIINLLLTIHKTKATEKEYEFDEEKDEEMTEKQRELIRRYEEEQTKQTEEEEEGKIKSSPNMKIQAIMPYNGDLHLKPGNTIRVVVGFLNTGENPFVVHYITGSMLLPDMSRILTNFTPSDYHNTKVMPKEEVSLPYLFYLQEGFEPRNYTIIMSVLYEEFAENRENFTDIFFNSTVIIDDITGSVDLSGVFTYMLLLGGFSYGGFRYYKYTSSKKKSAPSPNLTGKGKNQKINDDDEWLDGNARRRKKQKMKKNTPKNKKDQK
ncbi:translocon-associated protein subunit alpha [Anaeramoeba ignava]|uniref:Translocon-associated protein subunit alpha n=1 Tax=Anaeramoeba ignava TaxID=1746090 RepID=A0A9Q0RCW0_ANAIG|nr:translocon-associated protein subunit alpha [Anaeramoeba ignava]